MGIGEGAFGRMDDHIERIVSNVELGFALLEGGPRGAEAACAVSGKGRAGLSILPFGLSGMRLRGTNTITRTTFREPMRTGR